MKKLILNFALVLSFIPLALANHNEKKEVKKEPVEVIWKINSELYYYRIQANKFKKSIGIKTNNQVKIKIVEVPQDLDDPFQEIEQQMAHIYQIQMSNVEFKFSGSKGYPHIPELAVWKVPYLFKNKKHVEDYINSKNTENLLAKIDTKYAFPLTYSYAGGFRGISTFGGPMTEEIAKNNIDNCDFTKMDGPNDERMDHYLEELTNKKSCESLLYEIHEVGMFNEKLKEPIWMNISNHNVTARMTYVSKSAYQSIPAQYKDVFLKELKNILDEERHIIYERNERNIKFVSGLKNVNLHIPSEELRSNVKKKFLKENSDLLENKDFASELSFIESLLNWNSKVSSVD